MKFNELSRIQKTGNARMHRVDRHLPHEIKGYGCAKISLVRQKTIA